MSFIGVFDRIASSHPARAMSPRLQSGDSIPQPDRLRFDVITRKAIGRAKIWRQRAIDRAVLAAMNPRELGDFTFNPVEAWNEAHKPFWRE